MRNLFPILCLLVIFRSGPAGAQTYRNTVSAHVFLPPYPPGLPAAMLPGVWAPDFGIGFAHRIRQSHFSWELRLSRWLGACEQPDPPEYYKSNVVIRRTSYQFLDATLQYNLHLNGALYAVLFAGPGLAVGIDEIVDNVQPRNPSVIEPPSHYGVPLREELHAHPAAVSGALLWYRIPRSRFRCGIGVRGHWLIDDYSLLATSPYMQFGYALNHLGRKPAPPSAP